MLKILILFFLFTSSVYASKPHVSNFVKEALGVSLDSLAYFIVNHDQSMSGGKNFWENRGGFPWEIEELEKAGLIYILKYKLGKDGVGFKIYPTEKGILLLSKTRLAGKYKIVDIMRNLETAQNSGRYHYITKFK